MESSASAPRRDFFQLRPEVKLAAWLCLGMMLLVILDQVHYWQTNDDFQFGYIVPFFVLYVVNDRWPLLREILFGPPNSAAPVTAPPADAKNSLAAGLNFFAALVAVGSLLLFTLGGFLRAITGPDTDSASALGVGLVGFVLSMGFLVSRIDVQGRAVTLSARSRVVGLLLFPALAWLISAPMLLLFETRVKLVLLQYVVSIVSGIYSNILGFQVYRDGNVLVLPNGEVGVADACSGIRSLTACIFAGSFLAAVFLDRVWKKILLLILSAILAFFMNVCRSLFLTGWAYAHGADAINGDFWGHPEYITDKVTGKSLPNPSFHFFTVHDFAGYSVLGLTLAGLLLLIPLLNYKFVVKDESDSPPTPSDRATVQE